jgi:hypothetical protein
MYIQTDFINESLCQVHEASIIRAGKVEEALQETGPNSLGCVGASKLLDMGKVLATEFVTKPSKIYNYCMNYNEYSRVKQVEVAQCQIYQVLLS